ncbi:hypothetical protein [Tahibacter amnicola]|uniref:Uncharacterized protein n=1 Tax=Tahibacter amnicola TaxID=2976241 RepID=A0ABY6BFR9_9GAMM|nr:hypothetical protein [Tahibacter amnicola]UXI68362.1 hypothetical protein N4264_01540 [Tahibacter amnicola]
MSDLRRTLRAVPTAPPRASQEGDKTLRVPKEIRAKLKLIAHQRGIALHELTAEQLGEFCELYRSASARAPAPVAEDDGVIVPQDEQATLRVSRDLWAKVKTIAVSRDESVFDLTTRILGDYCARYESFTRQSLAVPSEQDAPAVPAVAVK